MKDTIWMREALCCLSTRWHQLPTVFTSDDVWDLLASRIDPPSEPRAMGALMREFRRRGWAHPTDAYAPGKHQRSHHRPVRLWKWTS